MKCLDAIHHNDENDNNVKDNNHNSINNEYFFNDSILNTFCNFICHALLVSVSNCLLIL